MSVLSQFYMAAIPEMGQTRGYQSSTGWLIDKDVNTNGMIVTNLVGWGGSGSYGYIYATHDSAVVNGSYVILRIQANTADSSMGAIRIPAGVGLYVTEDVGSIGTACRYTLL